MGGERVNSMESPAKEVKVKNGSLKEIPCSPPANGVNGTTVAPSTDIQQETIIKPAETLKLKVKVGSPPLPQEDPILVQKKVTSPPATVPQLSRVDSKSERTAPKLPKRENSLIRDTPLKVEKLSLVATAVDDIVDEKETVPPETENKSEDKQDEEESNGVGDKIKIFEKAASEANNGGGRVSRSGSLRLRARGDRTVTDIEDDLPPATPFKDNVQFELPGTPKDLPPVTVANNSVNTLAARWQRNDSVSSDTPKPRPEPQKIIKPEFKPLASPADVTIRSPSLGAKIADRFPSHGTAFRNVASPDQSRNKDVNKTEEDTSGDFRTCKYRTKERHSTGKSGGYFTRGSEEIWLVKKKDIEEIEERVLDSFRRAGGACGQAGNNRPAHEHSQTVRRHAYARSESLDPAWAATRAHTLKRQTSVACTCGHDRKTRSRTPQTQQAEPAARPRSRSHGDDAEQTHVLDKYETLV